MTQTDLSIPKSRRSVSLWVHPEGRVVGSIFLVKGHEENQDAEAPHDVMNAASPFIAVELDAGGELRFYNKNSIIRIEYSEQETIPSPDSTTLRCRAQIMDGTLLEGTIHEVLPPWNARLYDYINTEGHRFLKLALAPGEICLVNKAYVVHIAQLDQAATG
jgi:hypothetical protein